MSRTASIRAPGQRFTLKRGLAVSEILLVYAGILLYIWRWQWTHPHFWMPLWAVILASHLAHRDSLRDMGLTPAALRASAEATLPLVLAVYLPVFLYALARHQLVVLAPGKQALAAFTGYGTWCVVQQYLTQSYFHRRLMELFNNPHHRSLVLALMFGAAHIPNPVLMVVTTLGGFFLAEAFARHPNIWPLALAQTVGGFLIATLTPASLIHNMRVGPGYLFFGLHVPRY